MTIGELMDKLRHYDSEITVFVGETSGKQTYPAENIRYTDDDLRHLATELLNRIAWEAEHENNHQTVGIQEACKQLQEELEKEAPVAPVRKWEKDSTKINEVCDKWFEDEVMDSYYGVQKRFLKTGALYELKVVVGRLLEAEVQDALNGRKV
jgi:hypothetical protein